MLVAAGGGGMGPIYGLGYDADTGYYTGSPEGGSPGSGIGGGGAGLYGGQAQPYLYTCVLGPSSSAPSWSALTLEPCARSASYSCGSTFSPRTCYSAVYGPSGGGLSGTSGSFPAAWARGGFNGDGSAAARLVTFTFACVRSLVPFSRCVRRC